MKAVAAALGLALPFAAAKVSYDGYQAFHIDTPEDFDDVAKSLGDIDFVNLECGSNHKGFDIAVAPEDIKTFEKLNLKTKLIHSDLGADMKKEGDFKPYHGKAKAKAQGLSISGANGTLPDETYFESYHPLEEHHDFLDDLQAAFPDNSETFVAGKSGDGRDLKGIHLYGANGPDAGPAIIWHGTVHAREWIVAPTLEYMVYKIIEGYGEDETITSTLDKHDIYMIPVVNPDGFEYTNSEDRLWRKNRQERDGATCVGTDVNRNWPYKWDIEGGSSPDPCDETYRGEDPGDTPENKVLVEHTQSIADSVGIKFYVDWHSFSQLILLPYGFSCTEEIDDLDSQMQLAGSVAEAIEGVNGLEFVYGPTCETIYQTAGGSNDWAYDVAGAELAWAFELRPGSGGSGGFVIPPENIVPSGEENLAGMLALFASF